LVVNRREDGAQPSTEGEDLERDDHLLKIGKRRRRDDVEVNELDIRIKVSYKTLTMVFVLFSLADRIINSLSERDLSIVSEKLFGWFPF